MITFSELSKQFFNLSLFQNSYFHYNWSCNKINYAHLCSEYESFQKTMTQSMRIFATYISSCTDSCSTRKSKSVQTHTFLSEFQFKLSSVVVVQNSQIRFYFQCLARKKIALAKHFKHGKVTVRAWIF